MLIRFLAIFPSFQLQFHQNSPSLLPPPPIFEEKGRYFMNIEQYQSGWWQTGQYLAHSHRKLSLWIILGGVLNLTTEIWKLKMIQKSFFRLKAEKHVKVKRNF